MGWLVLMIFILPLLQLFAATFAIRVRMVRYSPSYVADHWCGVGSLRLEGVPPEIRMHAQAGYEALLRGDDETARRETGRAGTLLETFIGGDLR